MYMCTYNYIVVAKFYSTAPLLTTPENRTGDGLQVTTHNYACIYTLSDQITYTFIGHATLVVFPKDSEEQVITRGKDKRQ